MMPYHKEILWIALSVFWVMVAVTLNGGKKTIFGSIVAFLGGAVMGMGLMNWNNW